MQKLHPSEARPSGMKNAPKGTVRGKMPSMSGHKVAGKGTKNAPRGGTGGKTYSGSYKTGGKGTKSSRGGTFKGGTYGKGSY